MKRRDPREAAARAYLSKQSAKYGDRFEQVEAAALVAADPSFRAAYRNKSFLVQVFEEGEFIRLTINRCILQGFKPDGLPLWQGKISWDELWEIKNQLGYKEFWAVECYPPPDQLQNYNNMRHLWILPTPPEFGWHRSKEETASE